MITIAEIKTKIPSLSEDQASAALELVKSQVGETTRTIYSKLDNDILEVTGQKKPDGEKSYKFLRSILEQGKKSNNDLEATKANLSTLQSQYDELKGKVDAGDKSGATAEKVAQLEAQLKEAKDLSASLETQLTEKGAEWQKKLDDQASENERTRLDASIDRAFGSITFKDGLSKKMRELAEADARTQIHAMDREWVDNKVLFKGENGQYLRHDDTAIPFTVADIITKNLTEAEAIAVNRQQGGAGSNPPIAQGGQSKSGFQLTGERDQVTAAANLESHLEDQGLTPGTQEFQDAMNEAYDSVIIPAKLPTQVED